MCGFKIAVITWGKRRYSCKKPRIYNRDIRLLLLEWLGPIALTVWLLILMALCINPPLSWIDHLVEIEAAILAFIGVMFAVLIGVIVDVNIQSRNSKSEGFGRYRQGVISLENLVDYIFRRYPDDKQWLSWVRQTDDLNKTLNEITRGWLGWDDDKFFQNWLVEHVKQEKEITSALGFEGEHVDRIYSQAMKEILIGLHVMDEGIVGQRLVRRSFYQLGSLAGLILLALISLVSSIFNSDTFWGAVFQLYAISFVTIAHLSVILGLIVRWANDQEKRDAAWASVSGITEGTLLAESCAKGTAGYC